MNQKIIIVDNFYDTAHQYHKSFFENQCLITEETTEKISQLVDNKIEIIEAYNEVRLENTTNPITAHIGANWIGVIYLTMPSDCVSKSGVSFYKHKKTNLESFPDDYAKELFGFSSMEDIQKSFDVNNLDDWKEYSNIFIKYNRLVLFQADFWHSYGNGFGSELNNSMLYQKILIKNV